MRLNQTQDIVVGIFFYPNCVLIRRNNVIRTWGVQMNKNLLRSVMVAHGDKNSDLAAYLGITEQSVSNKINESGTDFKQGEIKKIAERYDLDNDQVCRIFFAN